MVEDGDLTEDDELEMLSVFGLCGGSIRSFKKMKSIFTALHQTYPRFLDRCEWDEDFFGPYYGKFTSDLRELWGDLFFNQYIKKENGGYYYYNELTSIGRIHFESESDKIKKLLQNKGIDVKKFALDCMVWNCLPREYVFNKAIEGQSNFKPKVDDSYPSECFWWIGGANFLEYNLNKYVENLRKQNILLEFKEKQQPNNRSIYKLNVSKGVSSARYNNLKPPNGSPRTNNLGQVSDSNMKKLGISKQELEQLAEDVKREFKENPEKYSNSYNSYMAKLEKFWEISNNCSEGLTVSVDKYDHFSITAYPDLKRKIPDWNMGYLNHAYHILRPENVLFKEL